ncbi:hypothetical protein D9M69_714900 [compost metagenome]
MCLGNAPAQRVGDPPELLPDHHLVEHRQLQAAVLAGHVHAAEAQLDTRSPVPGGDLLGQQPFVEFGGFLEGNQLFGEVTGLALPFQGFRGKGIGHC